MAKAKIYFTKNITPEGLVRAFDALGVDLPGKVGGTEGGEPPVLVGVDPDLVPLLLHPLDQVLVPLDLLPDEEKSGWHPPLL